MNKTTVSIGVLGVVALLFTNAFSIETAKPSPPDSTQFETIIVRDSVITEPGESVTVFKDGHAIPGEQFNKELLSFEYKDGWERVRGVLRWPRTLAPAVAIRVGFARRDSVAKKIEILCFEVTDEKGHVDVRCANPLGPKYAGFMWPAPAKDVKKLREHYNRGLAQSLKGKYDQALAEYEKALQYNPNAYQVHYNAGVAYVRLKQYAKAIFQLEHYLESKPDAENREETERIIEELEDKITERE